MNRCRHELETVPPHHVLDVVRVCPEGVEKVVGASGDVGIIAEEASTKAVTCVDVLSVHGVRGPAQVADDVVESRVVYVRPKKVTRDATNRRERPGKAHLPWRNAMTTSHHVYEVRPRKDHRGVILISDALPFGRLWYGDPNAISNAVDYAKCHSRL